jgi:hypothetical protein
MLGSLSLVPHMLGLIHAPVLDRAWCDRRQRRPGKCCYACTEHDFQGIAPCQTLFTLGISAHLQRRGSTECERRGKGLDTRGCHTQEDSSAEQDAPHGCLIVTSVGIRCVAKRVCGEENVKALSVEEATSSCS